MWSDPQENKDSAGYADPLIDSVFAITGAVIAVSVALILRALLS